MNKFFLGAIITIIIIFLGYLIVGDSDKEIEINNSTDKSMNQEVSEISESSKKGIEREIDTAKSVIKWKARRTLVETSNHDGTVNFESGKIIIEDKKISGGSFVIDMKSISSRDLSGGMKEKLEGHLKSEDFFSVDKFPKSQLYLKEVLYTDDHEMLITGDLTIKGISNEIKFPASISSMDGKLLISSDLEIDRTLWDIRFGSGKFFEDLGDKVINDNISLSLEIVI